MSKLLEFLEWWLKEATSPHPHKFVTEYGLCFNASRWGDHEEVYDVLHQRLKGLNYPFGQEDYNRRQDDGTMHLDPNRLAWVRKTIEELRDVQD